MLRTCFHWIFHGEESKDEKKTIEISRAFRNSPNEGEVNGVDRATIHASFEMEERERERYIHFQPKPTWMCARYIPHSPFSVRNCRK